MASTNDRETPEIAILREREAATREILQAISTSKADPTPVFDAILRNATRLSSAPSANLVLLNEDRSHWTLAAHHGEGLRHLSVGKTTALSNNQLVPAQAMRANAVVHVEDLTKTDLYLQGDPGRVAMVEQEGMRTIVGVPLLRDGEAIGCITLFRREVQAFSPEEIALVETFATQAVIAIENMRQFNDIQVRLEREAASRRILDVISTSRDDDQPVFDTILENAARLCRSTMARLHLLQEDGQHRRLVAHWGEDLRELSIGELMPMNKGHPISVSILDSRVIHIEDISETDLYLSGDPLFRRLVEEENLRTLLTVPLMRDGKAFGCIALSRRVRQAFTDQDINLVRTFAAQAVIAIDNVRQFREVRTRLEREIATKNILGVISRTSDDELPVFEAILENATRLCNAPMGGLVLVNEARDRYEIKAAKGARQSFVDSMKQSPPALDPEKFAAARAIVEKQVIHIEDLASPELYGAQADHRIKALQTEGMRTSLFVPLIWDDVAIGAIGLWRREVKPFDAGEIELVETFAVQAVIAIENVRQFKELETLNANLSSRVDQQVTELERMGRLKRFLPAAVADAVVSAGDDAMLSSHRARVATLFCDLRGFTAFCEAAEPEETIEVLQTYHQEMSALIDQYGGGVDQRAGDGIMVIFNDPIPCDDPAGDAVRLACAMRVKMRELCAQWKKLGHRLGFGIGISFGYATVGIVGASGRFDYTASGTAINTAARLCDLAANDEILISPRTWAAVEGTIEAESRGEVEMKGIREPVEVFAVLTQA